MKLLELDELLAVGVGVATLGLVMLTVYLQG